MLTADLVRARRQGSELLVPPLSPKLRPRALELAASLLDLAEACLGATRAELDEAFAQLEVRGSEHKLASGLRKLVEDRIAFEQASELEPRALRAELFLAAAQERKQLAPSESWQREAFLAREAARRELTPEALLRALYADLRGAQVLLGMDNKPSPEQLVDGYDLAQRQAVLLRATQLVANVRCRDAYAYRELFRKLKFFRLLHDIEARADGGYRIVIDGPFNLFSASTKYGLGLALSLPALLACDEHSITASLRWGKERTPMTFKIEGKGRPAGREPARLPDEVEALLSRFAALDTPWQAEAAADILEVPGVGLCVPDVRFVQRDTGELAYLEVLGYWSREAVFRRVDLVTRGLSARVLFAVSSRLRVSEEVLGDDLPSRLYVYKGALSAKELLRRLDQQPGLEDRMGP